MNNLIKSIETDIENAINIFCKNISEKYELDSVDLMTIWNTQNNIDAPQVNKTSKTNTKKTEKKVEKNLDQKICGYLFTKGKQQGECCGSKTKDGSNFCLKHNKY